ncbi:hypothetical protein LTR15_009698 [Elasticomyces elasticus]|nr:hypothetical protein LTR15_009698 [Elasticomyces elasticus]
MATSNHRKLAAMIEHYGEVADTVNRREMRRFIEEVRQMWATRPPQEVEWDPWGEGYTDEGAFTRCVYDLAFRESPERQGPLCEAEEKDEVLLFPVEDLENEIDEPLSDPLPPDELEEKLSSLEAKLQKQSANSKSIHLPDDFKVLMSITNGIEGAGVPAETANTILVYHLDHHKVWPLDHPGGSDDSLGLMLSRIDSLGFTALAGWVIGGCTQYRQIYYVFCHRKTTAADVVDNPSWRIFERADIYSKVYDNMTQFLQHEVDDIVQHPGGAQQIGCVVRDFYPH